MESEHAGLLCMVGVQFVEFGEIFVHGSVEQQSVAVRSSSQWRTSSQIINDDVFVYVRQRHLTIPKANERLNESL